jgi:hypothetical protein
MTARKSKPKSPRDSKRLALKKKTLRNLSPRKDEVVGGRGHLCSRVETGC